MKSLPYEMQKKFKSVPLWATRKIADICHKGVTYQGSFKEGIYKNFEEEVAYGGPKADKKKFIADVLAPAGEKTPTKQKNE